MLIKTAFFFTLLGFAGVLMVGGLAILIDGVRRLTLETLDTIKAKNSKPATIATNISGGTQEETSHFEEAA
jgi:hypothetical protein